MKLEPGGKMIICGGHHKFAIFFAGENGVL
jgi:hypothetical protein